MEIMEHNGLIREGERVDDLSCGGYRIIQDPRSFCFGIDAVLLANFAGKTSGKMIDLGTGNGVIPLLYSAKKKAPDITGLELMEKPCDRAKRSAELNGAKEIKIIHGDIRRVKELFSPGEFRLVTSNPPYITGGRGLENPDREKCVARHEVELSLEELCRAAAYLLSDKGSFCMIHKPFRLPEIMKRLMENGLEPKRLQMVQPRADRPPNMVLIESVKGAGPELKVLPALVVYDENGTILTSGAKAYYGEYSG